VTINFGMEVKVETSDAKDVISVNIVNFDHYDMIIGMSFMCQNKVLLDFEKNQVVVNGVATLAKCVVLDETDGQLCRYRSADK
jgi:hypothetical protein